MNMYKKINDEWNPHLIRKVKKTIKFDATAELLVPEKVRKQKEKQKIFLEKYKKACEIVKKHTKKFKTWIPLTYKLIPDLSPEKKLGEDILDKSKFGGIPDMTYWYDFVVCNEENKNDTLLKTINNNWPTCSCCQKKMQFLGQINLSEWLPVIHSLMYVGSERDIHYQRSGIGYGNQVGVRGFPSAELWFYFFFCDCLNFDNPNSDATIFIKHKFNFNKKKELPKKFMRDELRWSKKDYIKTMKLFMRNQRIHPSFRSSDMTPAIQLQFIEDLKLGFDLDYWETDYDFYEKVYYNKKYNGIFNFPNNRYQLFGAPRSQQVEYRYICYNSCPHIHRMAPAISWDDNGQDMTRQMYSCFCCIGQKTHIDGKMDNSCT